MNICAIIITFNRKNEVFKTVAALFSEGLAAENILVIDNASSDTTCHDLKSAYPELWLVRSDKNLASAGGFALAMKLAFEKGFDWLWLFNDDSRPLPGALNSVKRYLTDTNIKPGLIKISPVEKDGKALLLFWKGYRVPRRVELSNGPVRTDLVTFDGCFVSRELIAAIGTCDPEFFMGIYEFAYCLKASAAGFDIRTIPNGLLEDSKMGSASGTPPWRQYYNTRNHLWLGINRKSPQIILGWLYRETKYIMWILLFGKNKLECLRFKVKATWDAVGNRRGMRVKPLLSKNINAVLD
jgi:GT2 family glycosyltransferase